MQNQSCCSGESTTKQDAAGCCGNSSQSCCGDAVPDSGHEQASCGCGCSDAKPKKWIVSYVPTPVGEVPQVSTQLSFFDKWGFWKCRWSIGRMRYTIDPGLYCVGNPDANSPVLVTANYKMTFDRLRMELSGLDAWIVVLNTYGINVWCAAGKGTFGTEELVNRLQEVRLSDVVSHRTVILPQLGAVGVAAHEVQKQSGFRVVYGPIRACDIKEFLSSGMTATEEMRTVKFTIWDRLVLTPVEIISAIRPMVVVFGALFFLNAIGLGHYGIVDLYALLGAVFTGAFLTPVLLPWIPGRAFSFKGFLLGLLWAIGVNLINGFPMPGYGWLKAITYILVLPSLSAYFSMNFTGSSTYTSLSGVDKEMRIGLPVMIIAAAAGIILTLVNDFIRVFG
jgi:hypothetical protein